MTKRRVYYRRKRNLEGLYPTGKEKYLSVVCSLNGVVELRMLFLNKPLSQRRALWAYAKEVLSETQIQVSMVTLDLDNYILFDAIDRYNNGGLSDYLFIRDEGDFYRGINIIRYAYDQEKDILDAQAKEQPNVIYVDELGNTVPAVGKLQNFPEKTEEDINLSFQ